MNPNEPILFGVCDQKPGEFYVATLFTPQTFIPLIPKSSWVVHEAFAPVTHGPTGYYASTLDSIEIPLSLKSVFLAYARCFLIGLGGVSLVITAVYIVRLALFREVEMLKSSIWALLCIGSAVGYWASITLSGPGPRKVQYLRDLIADNSDDHGLKITLAQDEAREPNPAPPRSNPLRRR